MLAQLTDCLFRYFIFQLTKLLIPWLFSSFLLQLFLFRFYLFVPIVCAHTSYQCWHVRYVSIPTYVLCSVLLLFFIYDYYYYSGWVCLRSLSPIRCVFILVLVDLACLAICEIAGWNQLKSKVKIISLLLFVILLFAHSHPTATNAHNACLFNPWTTPIIYCSMHHTCIQNKRR